MGLFNFMKDAGEKLFGGKKTAAVETVEDPAQILERTVQGLGLKVENLGIQVDESLATVTGAAASQEIREKVVLLVGNTHGIAQVDDQMTVETPEPEAKVYVVERGDTLGKIAKEHYGSAGKYTVIFEANKPMLKDPDKIYPGQALRIPPLK